MTTTKELRVTGLHVKDVLGVSEFKMSPGRVTVLRGKNESGKSSLLGSVMAALGRGSLAKIARIDPAGAETSPEVCLILEGGGEHYRVERTGDKVKVRKRVGETAALEDVPRPQEFLAGLFDPTLSNPVRFLSAPDKERAILLLEALPLRMDRAALYQEMGVTADEVGPVPEGLHPLEETGLIRDAVFRKRTGVNVQEKAAKNAAEQLKRNIPADLAEDPKAAIDELEGAVSALTDQIARSESDASAAYVAEVAAAQSASNLEDEKIRGTFKSERDKRRAQFAAWEAARRAVVEKEIAAEKDRVEAEIVELKTKDEARLEQLDVDLAAATRTAEQARDAKLSALAALRAAQTEKREKLAALRAQADRLSKDKALTEQAAEFDRHRERLAGEAGRLTAALEALDAYRRRMAESLPIPGLTIEDKVIRVNGIPFDQLNTAQRVDLAVQVAVLRAKGQKLPVIFVDGAENLDSEHFEMLVGRLAAAGVQAFLGRVADSALEVEVA